MPLEKLNHTRRFVQICLRHGLLGVVGQLGLTPRGLLSKSGTPQVIRDAHWGRRVTKALNELGPTFIKVGQVLSTRTDILPEALVGELVHLQDNATPVPFPAIVKQIEGELDAPLHEYFSWIDETPLAAASISQVHRAKTIDGEAVVIKVRRPGIAKRIRRDLALLRHITELANNRVPAIARLEPMVFVADFEVSLFEELDFKAEAQALQRAKHQLAATARVPQVFPRLSGDKILTMEYMAGGSIAQLHTEGEKRSAAEKLVACFAEQYLRDGHFHGNPHPGNILVQPDGQLVLLDFGAVGFLAKEHRRGILHLAGAAASRNGEQTASAVLGMSKIPQTVGTGALKRELGAVLHTVVNSPVGATDAIAMSKRCMEIAQSHGLTFQKEYFRFFRSILLLDGVLRMLDPQMDLIVSTRKHLIRSSWRPSWMRPSLHITGVALWSSALALPRVAQIAAGLGLLGGLVTAIFWIL